MGIFRYYSVPYAEIGPRRVPVASQVMKEFPITEFAGLVPAEGSATVLEANTLEVMGIGGITIICDLQRGQMGLVKVLPI